MKRPRTLSATFVERVSQPGFYGDGRGGHGLSLLVKRMASTGRVGKSWCQRIRLGGKPRNIGLGVFPLVSLAEAREAARDAAGRRAAAGLEARAMAQGLAAVVLTPAHGDFNDDLAALGPRALAARLAPLLGPGNGP